VTNLIQIDYTHTDTQTEPST